MFWTDSRAARLSPAVDQLVVAADPAAVRAAVGREAGVRVLTGREPGGATTAACAAVAVVSSVAPAALCLRRPAVGLAGLRD
ncbi:hypothetical protein [Streptomyces erythrochromogenes]|uniref:hypothetical protein n=1 Tax=Streptomyces erythrochromogenes TaxID=285574 RepID=UPI0033F9AB43